MTETKAIKALLTIIATIAEVLKESPDGIPEGHLYAMLMPMGCGIESFNKLVSMLVESGRAKKRGNILSAA